MRVSPSQLRDAAINPSYRIPTPVPGKQGGGPSTTASLRKAIRTFHSSDAERARRELASSFVKPYWKSGAGLTMVRNAKKCLDTYIKLATPDARPAFAGTHLTLTVGADSITTNADVILFDDDGYTVRLCLDGALPRPLTAEQRVMIATPTLLAVANDLETAYAGAQVHRAEVWELRTGSIGTVSRPSAEAFRSGLRALLARIAPL